MTDIVKLKLPKSEHNLIPLELDDMCRIGRDNDGGYVLSRRMIEQADAVLALGLNNDWSFEEALVREKRGLRVHGYDHTVNRKKFSRIALIDRVRALAGRCAPSIAFESAAVVKSYDRFFTPPNQHHEQKITNRPSHLREQDVTGALDALGGSQVLLKMDIEGSEYRVYEQLLENSYRIVGACIEFHDTDPLRAVFNDAIRRLLTRFAIVHVHPNNYGGVALDGLPDVLEVTLLNRDLVTEEVQRQSFLIPGIDHPNDPSKPEFALTV